MSEPTVVPGLIEGRIIHFIPSAIQGFVYPDRHIPGVITRVWDRYGCCNLMLFLDGPNDHPDWRNFDHVTSVPYDPEGKKPYSWHYLERVD